MTLYVGDLVRRKSDMAFCVVTKVAIYPAADDPEHRTYAIETCYATTGKTAWFEERELFLDSRHDQFNIRPPRP